MTVSGVQQIARLIADIRMFENNRLAHDVRNDCNYLPGKNGTNSGTSRCIKKITVFIPDIKDIHSLVRPRQPKPAQSEILFNSEFLNRTVRTSHGCRIKPPLPILSKGTPWKKHNPGDFIPCRKRPGIGMIEGFSGWVDNGTPC